MADKLEKMQAMAALAKSFGGDPESEMRNRLLEAQIQAGREQTQAMRHQTQGGMMKAMMDMQKMQSDLQFNPLRREALGAEIAASNQRTAASQAANVRAGELHEKSIIGQQLIIDGQRTGNAQQITRGQEMVEQSRLEREKTQGDIDVQTRETEEWGLGKDLRTQTRETAVQEDAAKRQSIYSRLIADYLSKVSQGFGNLPPNMRETAATGLQEIDPSRRSPEGAPFTKRMPGPMVTPSESTASLMASTSALAWLQEQIAKGSNKTNKTPEEQAKDRANLDIQSKAVFDALMRGQQLRQQQSPQ